MWNADGSAAVSAIGRCVGRRRALGQPAGRGAATGVRPAAILRGGAALPLGLDATATRTWPSRPGSAGAAACPNSGRTREAIEECRKAAFARLANGETPPCASRSRTRGCCSCRCSSNPARRRPTLKSFTGPSAPWATISTIPPATAPCCRQTKISSLPKKSWRRFNIPLSPSDDKDKGQTGKTRRRRGTIHRRRRNPAAVFRPVRWFFPTELEQQRVYGLRHRTQSSTLLVLLSEAGIASALTGYRDTFAGTGSAYRILEPPAIRRRHAAARRQNLHRRALARRLSRVGRWNSISKAATFSKRRPEDRSPCMSGPASWSSC